MPPSFLFCFKVESQLHIQHVDEGMKPLSQQDLLVFAFTNTIAARVLQRLNVANAKLVRSDVQSIEQLVTEIVEQRPSKVVGLGQYTGRDQDKLRIETRCNNAFRNTLLHEPKLDMQPFVSPRQHSKYARGLGNSFCNLVSLKVINTVPSSQYSFIHIPKRFDPEMAAAEIQSMLDL